MKQNENTWFYIGGSGLDRTNDLKKICGSELDRIQFFRIKAGLGLQISQSAHLCQAVLKGSWRAASKCGLAGSAKGPPTGYQR